MITTERLQRWIGALILIVLGLCVMAVMTHADAGGELLPALPALAVCAMLLRMILVSSALMPADRPWLMRLCFVAFLMRVAVALFLYYGPSNPHMFADDQSGYDIHPAHLARFWQGTEPCPGWLYTGNQFNRIGYYTFVALQYSLFGCSPIVPRLFNALGGALFVILAYQLGMHAFGRIEGKQAALWAALFPSLVLWSALNIRDVWLGLSVLLIVWHATRLREQLSGTSLLMILASMVWIQYSRPYLFAIMVVATASVLFLARSQHLGRDMVLALGFVALLAVLHSHFGVGEGSLEYANLEKLSHYRNGMANSRLAHSAYLSDVDLTNPVAFVSFLPAGVVYFLFSPFPWQVHNLRQLITLPEMIAWYCTVPCVWASLRQVFKDRTRRRLALLLPLIVITFAYVLGSGNSGTAYRYRSQIITIYLVFGSAGLVQRDRERRARRVSSAARNLASGSLPAPLA